MARETKSDMDEPDTCLIAAHGYCSQDLVNLVLTGHAVTNCFDGEREVGGKVCRGVLQRSRLGFLSLFEWFGYTQVGRYRLMSQFADVECEEAGPTLSNIPFHSLYGVLCVSSLLPTYALHT